MSTSTSTSTSRLRRSPSLRLSRSGFGCSEPVAFALRAIRMAQRMKKLPLPTPSEAAFERLLSEFPGPGHPDPSTSSGEGSAGDLPPENDARAFLDELYARADVFLERDPYATIGDASGFNTKVVGVSFEGRQDVVAGVRAGAPLELRRHPENTFDPNAIGVWFGALQLGFLKRPIAARIAPNIDEGERYVAEVTALTG